MAWALRKSLSLLQRQGDGLSPGELPGRLGLRWGGSACPRGSQATACACAQPARGGLTGLGDRSPGHRTAGRSSLAPRRLSW